MVPLDGPWSEEATVGGMVAANINGSRRRLYGTARDLVIGMKFATLDGKLKPRLQLPPGHDERVELVSTNPAEFSIKK